MAAIATIQLRPYWEVLRGVRGRKIPAGKRIASNVDKARRNARREFNQNRHRLDF